MGSWELFYYLRLHRFFASPDDVSSDDDNNDAIGNMLLQSISLIGVPYKWGGNTPQSGLDCSGYIRYVYQKSLGITLPRTASQMARVGRRVSVSDLEPGDLLFFNTRRGRNTHVGMYIGNNKFIQSPRTGEVIQITELNSAWRSKLNGAKRIIEEDVDDSGNVSLQNYQDVTNEALPAGRIRSRSTKSKHYKKNKLTKHKSHSYRRNISKKNNVKSKKKHGN